MDAISTVNDHMMSTMWGPQVFVTPGMLGLMTALPLAAVALWRAGLVRWWAPLSVLAGTAAFMLGGATWWGNTITAVFWLFTLFAVALERATRQR